MIHLVINWLSGFSDSLEATPMKLCVNWRHAGSSMLRSLAEDTLMVVLLTETILWWKRLGYAYRREFVGQRITPF